MDREINRLDNLDVDDLERIREKRRLEFKKEQKRKDGFLQLGHGEYTDSQGEMDFFNYARSSPKVVGYIPFRSISNAEIGSSLLQAGYKHRED